MRSIFLNLRYAMRQLRKAPVFTLTAVLTLALGIGANTAIFTAVYATLLAPMPYPEPNQLVVVWSKIQGFHNSIAAQDFVDWKNQSKSFQDLNAWTGGSFNLATKDQPEYVEGQMTTPGFYRMMGVKFQYGRDFLPEEGVAGRDHVVVLINKLWKRLGSDPKIIGKQIQIDGTPYTVVGVMAPGQPDRLDQNLVVPLVFKPEQLNHDFHWLLAMGRLEARSDHQAGAGRHGHGHRQHRAGFSQEQQGMGRVCRTAQERFPAQGKYPDPVDAARRGGLCAFDRLRECGQPAASQGNHAAKRSGCAHLTRRYAHKYLCPVPD